MAHYSYETISRRTDEENEAIDRKDSRDFRRSWSVAVLGLPTLALLIVLVGVTIAVALSR